MNKLATLFAGSALALCGAVFAEADLAQRSAPPDEASQVPSELRNAQPSGQEPKGFVVLQRNIYVPIDADGKVASNEWVVVERHGFIGADELKGELAEGAAQDGSPADNGPGGLKEDEQAPSQEEPAGPARPKAPAVKGRPMGWGAMINS